MIRRTASRAASLANKTSEWLILAVLLAGVIPPVMIRHRCLTVLPGLDLIDGSWLLDTSFKAAGGIWFGRDVAFTYGPFFQWLASAPSRWIGVSVGAAYDTFYTGPFLLITIATFLSARLLLPEVAAWRRALFLFLVVVFLSPPDVRISVSLLAFAIFVRLTDAAASPRGRITLLAVVAATICLASFLFSTDAGIYTSASLLLCVGATAIAKRVPKRMARFLIVASVAFSLLALVTHFAMASPIHLNFWRSSLAIASAYRWFEAAPMTKEYKYFLVRVLILGIVIFSVAWCWRKPGGSWTRRPAFLLSGFCVALLMAQSALVRSDYGHVLIGSFAMLFLCTAIVMDESESRVWSMALPTAAIIAGAMLIYPQFANRYTLLRPADVIARLRQMAHPVVTCPAGMTEFDHACLPPTDVELLSKVSAYVNLHTPPGARIAVFPYQTIFGLVSRHEVAGGVLQSYLVNGEYLANLQLAGLQRSNPPFALYFPDGILSGGIDYVPNLTRSPGVWLYLLHHYRMEGSPSVGVVGLLRDDTRDGRLNFTEEGLVHPPGLIKIFKRTTAIEIAPIRWPEAGPDFVKIRLRMNYSPLWKVRKPSRTRMQLSYANGTVREFWFVLPPNESTDIWLYPWDETKMGNYFSNDESQWRSDTRPALTSLKLLVNPQDWVSVIPSSANIEAVEAVRVSLK